MVLLDLLGRRWTLRIVWELRDRPMSFRDLRGACSEMSPSVLNQRLAELRDAGIVLTTASGYALSETGHELLGLMKPLATFAERWASRLTEQKRP
ncbi:MAG TPA: helix-turn-helix domain-containing protein [Gammaproteobacteria bacterium]|nr:helix-turn-helix domain-containing protein [Gammaproteobacteria bacterium]